MPKPAERETLTDARVKNAKPDPKKQYQINDARLEGLAIRIMPSGRKSWILSYKKPETGKFTRWKIGKYTGNKSGMTLAEARKKAGPKLNLLQEDTDPAQVERTAAENRRAHTFKSVVDEYLEARKPDLRPSTYGDYKRKLRRLEFRDWETRPIASITRDDVYTALKKILDRGKKRECNLTFAVLHKFFDWAELERGIPFDRPVPTCRMKKLSKEKKNKNPKNKRLLTHAEIRKIWAKLETKNPYHNILKILFYTGLRTSEVAGMRWSELDIDNRVWLMSGERTKNGYDHKIYLTDQLLEIIEKQPVLNGGDWVFPASRAKKDHFDAKASKLKKNLDEACEDIAPWQVRHIRPTMRTAIVQKPLSVPVHVAEAMLNHQSGTKAGISGTYDHADYWEGDETPDAWTRWANYLDHLLAEKEGEFEADKVVDIRAASR